MNKVAAMWIIANDIKLHLPSAMFKSADFSVSTYEITLPIQVFDYERFEMGHANS